MPHQIGSDGDNPALLATPVLVELDETALYFASYAADAVNMSLSAWVCRAAVSRALHEDAPRIAESNRLHPDEPLEWQEMLEEQMFRDDGGWAEEPH